MKNVCRNFSAVLLAAAFVLVQPGTAFAGNASTSWNLPVYNTKVSHYYVDQYNTIRVSRSGEFGRVRTYIKPRSGVRGPSASVEVATSANSASRNIGSLPENKAYTLYGQVYAGGKWVTKKSVNFTT